MRQFGSRLAQLLISSLKLCGAQKHTRFELVIHFLDFLFGLSEFGSLNQFPRAAPPRRCKLVGAHNIQELIRSARIQRIGTQQNH